MTQADPDHWEKFLTVAAINTLDASCWTLWRARLFGMRVVSTTDSGRVVSGRFWKGKFYITGYKRGDS